ncbi:polysaccharide biosynthesis/export family protein [Sphingomonadaceae bacterium jetA1]|jgi:polysaccharide export outer membrane protein|uniref:polysaccharide biosynthesis/export family protein n=1 Tax=Facivitalis istanbulensis TaxID=3075838 RepID=UPI003479760F
MSRKFVVLGSALILAACGGGPRLGESGDRSVTIVGAKSLPTPDRRDFIGNDRPYLIGPFDKLTIDVFGINDLSAKQAQVDASGRLSFPLIGVIEVAGHTPGEVERIIKQRLSERFVRDPQVTVNLVETVSRVITVDGQVKEPGLYPVIGRMTLMRAIATAKGADEFAKLDDVVIFRTVNGQKMAALYNLKAIRQGNYEDPEVFANDVVVVGESRARRLFKDLLQAAPLLTTPLIIALQR